MVVVAVAAVQAEAEPAEQVRVVVGVQWVVPAAARWVLAKHWTARR